MSNSFKRALLVITTLFAVCATNAAPVQLTFTSTVSHSEGSYAGNLAPGLTLTGTYIFDTDINNAGPGSDPNPSLVSGHEYSSFWEFSGNPYGASLLAPLLGSGFSNEAPLGVVINNNLHVDSEETGGLIATGFYDWIELLASSTIDFCNPECMPAGGEEWSLAIFSGTDWITDDAQIPAQLNSTYTAFLIGLEFDELGNEIGLAIAPLDSLSVSAVPVPPAFWLLLTALASLGWRRHA